MKRYQKRGVLTINFVFYIDFYIFSVFTALVSTEIMGSVVLLLWWNKYKSPVLQYIVPIWEITGTFGAFWVVLSDFAFPVIIIPLAELFAAAILVFLIFFVARNASISFAEYILKKGWLDERKLYVLYSLSTILMGLVVLYIISSIIGGFGVKISTNYIPTALTNNASFVAWLSHPADILFIIGTVIILLGLAPIFYGAKDLTNASVIFSMLGTIISIIAVALFNVGGMSGWLIIPIVLTIAPSILFKYNKLVKLLTNKLAFIIWLSIDLFSLNFLVFPNAFGRRLPVNAVTTSGSMVNAYYIITLIGSIILLILIAVFAVATHRESIKAATQ